MSSPRAPKKRGKGPKKPKPYDLRRKNDPVLREKRQDYERQRQLRKRYGLEYDDYIRLCLLQRGLCAICMKELTETPHIDHCHATGKVRGLLCRKCNLAIGHFDDNIRALRRAAWYLERDAA